MLEVAVARESVWDVALPLAHPHISWVCSKGQDGLKRQEWQFGLIKWPLIVYAFVCTHIYLLHTGNMWLEMAFCHHQIHQVIEIAVW